MGTLNFYRSSIGGKMAPNKLPSNRIPPVLPEAPAHHKGDVCIRPKKLPTVDHSVRYPLLGKVGSSDGLSLLRYRIAPAVVPERDRPKEG